MHIIKVDKKEFDIYLERTEAAYKAENEIIEEMLSKGINGLEWLIMHVIVDDKRKESLEQWLELSPMIAKGTKDPLIIFKSALRMNPEAFYEKHELNWYIAIDEALTYFALLKEKNYNFYFDVLQEIYRD